MILSEYLKEKSSRRRRRKIVAVMYLSLVAFTSSGLAGPTLEDAVGEWVWWLLIPPIVFGVLLTFIALAMLRSSIQNLADGNVEELDERQRLVRYLAHHRSYKILAFLTIISMSYLMLAIQIYPERLWLPKGNEFYYVNMAVLCLLISLPTAVIAWTEPDPEPEIEEETNQEFAR